MSVCKSRLPKTKIIQIGLYLLENFPHFPKQTWCTNLKLCGLTELITIYRTSHWRCSIEKGVLKYFTKFTWKHLCQSLFFNKVAETLAQVFSCRFCEIFKNTFFYRTPPGDCFNFVCWKLSVYKHYFLKMKSNYTFS